MGSPVIQHRCWDGARFNSAVHLSTTAARDKPRTLTVQQAYDARLTSLAPATRFRFEGGRLAHGGAPPDVAYPTLASRTSKHSDEGVSVIALFRP